MAELWSNGRMVEWREWLHTYWQEWQDGGWNGRMVGMAGMVEWQKEWQNGRMAENEYIRIHTYYLRYTPTTLVTPTTTMTTTTMTL